MKYKDGTYLESLQFQTPVYENGIYVDEYFKHFKICKEQDEIIDFLNNTITRANKYKIENNCYPDCIEELIAWEETNYKGE